MQRIAPSQLPQAQPQPQSKAPAPSQKSHYFRPLSPKSSIYLGIRPTEDTGREIKDALLEYTSPSEAASFVFSCSPASKLSQEWRVIIVEGNTAHSFAIDAGAVLIPSQPQSWHTLKRSDLAWRYPRVGFTGYSVEEIGRKALKISWPMRYSTYSENGQKFTHALFEAIRIPNQPASVSDVLSGLEKIPGPFGTLRDRCLAVILASLVAGRDRVLAIAEQRIGAPVRLLVKYGIWGRDVLISCFVIALLALSVFLQIVVVVFFLIGDRDLLKASRELRDIADGVRRFDGYGRLEKDHDKLL